MTDRSPELGDEIARLSAHIQAATARLLDLIRRFDASEAWYDEGFTSCAAWLSWRTGTSPGAAREKVRVAKALGDLPQVRAALGRGQLSYSVARALTRIATPANEAELLEVARHSTAAQLERLVTAWRAADRDAESERERHARRALWLIPESDGSWSIRGRLDPEVGAVLARALDAAGDQLFTRDRRVAAERADSDECTDADEPAGADAGRQADEDAGPASCGDPDEPPPTPEARRADAIGLLAEAALRAGVATRGEDGAAVSAAGRAERFQVVVHVSAETLAGQAEVESNRVEASRQERTVGTAPYIAGGPDVSAETSRRLGCDAGVVHMTHDRDGRTLDVGRRRRTVPTPLRRALERRDRRCRFPACRSRHCDAHHVRHWAEGGETRLDNLVLLCRHHHRRVHEDGWRVTLGPDGDA
ncbi:MAG: HNH endonuclease, partial [Gemmatimonadetes bacterium]|nr:HNH endonuclease [Gemmatimonadota bacterium]